VGLASLAGNTSGADNAAFGYASLQANTSGVRNSAFGGSGVGYDGFGVLGSNTTGADNAAFGDRALKTNTTGSFNTALGSQALLANTTANNNTAVGYQAGYSNTTAGQNTFIGYQAGFTNTTGDLNTFIGYAAGSNVTTGFRNTFVGRSAGGSCTTGNYNTFMGIGNGDIGAGSGVTTGSKNIILGGYSGSTAPISATGSNYIVLSDGDGNVRQTIDSSGNVGMGTTAPASATNTNSIAIIPGSGQILHQHLNGTASGSVYSYFIYNGSAIASISQNGTTAVAYNTSSDYRLKENIVPITGALSKVALLKPVTYTWKSAPDEAGEGFIAHELAEVCPQAVHGTKDAVDADGKPVYQGIDTSFLVATLTAAIQELKAEFDAYKASHP
jgi:hypothetical protein